MPANSTCAHDDFVAELLALAKQEERCVLCGTDSTYRTGLCRHCYEMNRALRKAGNRLSELGTEMRGIRKSAEHEVGVLRQKTEDCKKGAALLRIILDGEVSGHTLEKMLEQIARDLVKEELFDGIASRLTHSFSATQRKYLAYMLWHLRLASDRRSRRRKAASRLVTNDSLRARVANGR